MAKFFKSKTRKRAITALSVFLAASLSLGAIAACATTDTDTDTDTDSATLPADTQLIKNGNFEFYDEVVKEKKEEKKNLISTPNSWTFNSGSPSSATLSGIINAKEWDYLTKSTSALTSIDDAVARWNEVSAYDRLKFYDDFSEEIAALDASSEAKKLFNEYNFRIDFEDVEDLRSVGETFPLHPGVKSDDDGNPVETSVLMIHNQRAESSENVIGTAQYYNSSTTITLESGTAAELSVWVKTAELYHNAYQTDKKDYQRVEKHAGAYIGVTHTVGGTTLDDMQIKNINTKGEWEEYKLYIRASSYATSTFRIKLGLGLGSNDDRYESVNGYAFFDDLTCERISSTKYDEQVKDLPTGHDCNIFSRVDDAKNEKVFDMDELKADDNNTFALDLNGTDDYKDYHLSGQNSHATVDVDLTKEISGRKSYTSADKGYPDTRTTGDADKQNIAGVTSLSDLKTLAATNGYLKGIFEDELDGKYPFLNDDGDPYETEDMIFILSANGAAYTATIKDETTFTLAEGKNMLLSFWVKTYDLPSGKTGAGAILVDGENKTTITPFNSHNVSTVDLDDKHEDIYMGWVQCFFFIANNTKEDKTFHLELTYGPTAIASTSATDYAGGYAAFTHFEVCTSFDDTLMSYASSSGDHAQKVSLTGYVDPVTRFDTVKAGEDVEHDLALPTAFTGVVSGSHYIDPDFDAEGDEADALNSPDEGLYAGLLSREYAKNYAKYSDNENIKDDAEALAKRQAWKKALGITDDSKDGATWWNTTFGSASRTASQPLVIVNANESKDIRSYGFYTANTTISANSYQKIAIFVKLSANATAYVYLADRSDPKQGTAMLSTNLPGVTYWYDDEGNIVSKDPSDKDFNAKTDVLYYLENNGLYTKKGANDGKYYANLYNYKTENGNLVTKDGTVAFYGKDGKYYAYYDEDTGLYSREVENLPKVDDEGNSITRYEYSDADAKQSVIKVTGNGTGASEWVEVAFYVHTGNEAKTYRLEVWAGARSGDDAKIKAGEYVMFDNYRSTTSSDYDAMLNEATRALLDKSEDNHADDPDNAGEKLADKLSNKYALYYTFTFFDSASYLRYDETEDEDGRGNPWQDYLQSDYSEQLVYLYCEDADGTLLNVDGPLYEIFLDYSAVNVTVDEADLNTDSTTDTDDDTGSDVNVWLLISSGVLALVLIFAMGMVGGRMIMKKMKKSGKHKPAAKKAPKAKKAEEKPEEEPLPDPDTLKPVEPDENDPYNE